MRGGEGRLEEVIEMFSVIGGGGEAAGRAGRNLARVVCTTVFTIIV